MIKLKNVFISNFQGGGGAGPPGEEQQKASAEVFPQKKNSVCFEIYKNLKNWR